MKKLILLLFIPIVILSCQKKAKDIKVDELNTACEFADAFYIIIKEIEDLVEPLYEERYESLSDLPEPIRTDVINLGILLEDVDDRIRKKFRFEEVKKCDKWDKAMQIVKEIEKNSLHGI